MRQLASIAIVTALVCAYGCGGRDTRLQASVEVKGVEALGGDLAYVQSSGVLQRVNVMAGDPKPATTKTPIRSAPRKLAKRPYPADGTPVDELLIVSDGRSDEFGQILEPPALTAVTANNDVRVYDLSHPGQLLRLSNDGQFAVLFDDPSTSASDTLLTNRNEIAIVDLTPSDSGPKKPTIRTLDAVGGSPQALWFANLQISNTLTPFVLFSFPKGVSLTQLTGATDPGHKLDLSSWVPAPSTGAAPVADVRVDSTAGKIYLRNSTSPDIQVLSVVPSADGVDVSQNTLTVGTSAPSDFSVYSQPDGTRLVATVGKSVAVVAADSNTVTPVPLTYAADSIFLFEGTAPKDANSRQRAVLYKAGETGLTFVDLEDLELKTTKALQAVDLVSQVGSVQTIPSMKNSLLIFLTGGGIEVLDLQTRRWSPIGSAVGITATIADMTQNRSWVTEPGDKRVGYLDYGDPSQPTLGIGEIRLDDPVAQFFRLDADSMKRVIVTHDLIGGSVTLFDAVKPSRSTAKKLEGFLLSDLL